MVKIPSNEKNPTPLGLVVRDEQGHALIEMLPADNTLVLAGEQEPKLDGQSIAQLNHLLSLVPDAASAVAGNAQQLMTCSFDYSKLIQAKDGSGAIGGVYKEGTNQIGAQARFHEAKELKAIVNTSLLLNIASQVLAQKHLADINDRLKSIERQVNAIQQHLEQSRFAKIKTFQEHLQRVGSMLQLGDEILPGTLQLLAEKAQNVRAEVIHLQDDLKKSQQEILCFDTSNWFDSNDLREQLKRKIDRISKLQREYLLGMQCLLVANFILFIKHDGNKEFVHAGDAYLAELEHEHGLLKQWETFKRQVAVRLSKMKPIFELSRSTEANVYLVNSAVQHAQLLISQDIEQLQDWKQRMVQAQNPRLLLTIEGRKIVRGHYLKQ